jgi:RNA polymerase sigma-70 factor (ECF subfamily)
VDDLALARRLRDGEAAAFDEFFAGYFPRLCRFAAARIHADVVEEAVQATLVRAVRGMGTYRGEASLFTWLCTICRHEIARLVDAGRAGLRVDLQEEVPAVRAALESLAGLTDADPERSAQRHELSRLVHATLDQLPARYGDALEWRYIDGLSVDEVAARLGVGYKAAESLLSRARDAFRDGFRTVVPEA